MSDALHTHFEQTLMRALLVLALVTAISVLAAEQPSALKRGPLPVQMLVPGFTVRELPIKLTSLNNIEYAPDGRLFAGGYDGRFHLLRDTDSDGLEDNQRQMMRTTPPFPSVVLSRITLHGAGQLPLTRAEYQDRVTL